MRILVLGHQGMLGSELLGRLLAGHEVTGKDIDDFDIVSEEACRRVVEEAEPDVVINAAAYTDVDGSEKARELCFAVNAEGVKNVALACRPAKIKIVHFSTDYVFDGTKDTPYREEDACRPLNVYGEAKLAGEKNLQRYSEHYLLVRTAWLREEGEKFCQNDHGQGQRGRATRSCERPERVADLRQRPGSRS
jgi:dTDP-4-dehydrorhamnose reductase